jgi:hypothetical protein
MRCLPSWIVRRASARTTTANNLDLSKFITVDLEILSKRDLKPLVDALAGDVSVSYLGKEYNLNKAYFGWVGPRFKSPDDGVLRYCKLIRKLDVKARELWNSAKSRSFDVGFQSPARETYYWSAIGTKAVRAAAELSAQIAITIYGPMKPFKKQRSKLSK